MTAESAAASRRLPRPVPLSTSSRVRLDERTWRRIINLGDTGKLYSVGICADEVRLVWRSRDVSQEFSNSKKAEKAAAPSKRGPASSQDPADRPERALNSAQRRSRRRAEKHFRTAPWNQSVPQPAALPKPLNPDAQEFEPPKQLVEIDATAGGEAPASPSREQERLLLAASESLAARQQQRQAAQRHTTRIHRVGSTRQRVRGAKAPSRNREGPGLEPLDDSD